MRLRTSDHRPQARRRLRSLLPILGALGLGNPASAQDPSDLLPPPPPPARDRYLVSIGVPSTPRTDPSAGGAAPAPAADTRFGGRLLLFLVPDSPEWDGVAPVEGPFLGRLQPIAGLSVSGLEPGTEIELTDEIAEVFGGPLDELEGSWRIQAVLDSDRTERGHLGLGNLLSEVVTATLARDTADEIRIAASRPIEPAPLPEIEGVEWIVRRSDRLSRHFGRTVELRAGVVLPYGYDDLAHPRRFWPTIYVIGGFGADHRAAATLAPALREREARAALPQAVWVFLDADTPWGHSGFCDSEANGPIGTALVEEFVPFLEERFRLIAAPEARLLTGHSSGGWTALHLLVEYPDVFGRAWSSAPDPVDFSAFQRTDLYRARSLFAEIDGAPTPSARRSIGPEDEVVSMTVADEYTSERVIDPLGRSGEQWSAWEAMWSPLDPATGAPRPLCDPATGAIDPVVVEAWSSHDLAGKLEAEPARVAPILADRARILCGSRDTYYLNEAVARLKARLAGALVKLRGDEAASQSGSIEIIDGLTHDTLYPLAQLRFHQEMRDHLLAEGLAELPAAARTDERTTERGGIGQDLEAERLDRLRETGRPSGGRDDTPRRQPRPQRD